MGGHTCCRWYSSSVRYISLGSSFIRLSTQEGGPALRTVVGMSPPRAWAVMGAYTAKTAVVVSPPHRGVFLGSANSGCPAKMVVVLMPPRCVVSLAFASSEDGGGVRAASLCGSPRVRKLCVSSEDGGGARATSAGLRLLWLGLFKGVQAATTAVGFSLRRFRLS